MHKEGMTVTCDKYLAQDWEPGMFPGGSSLHTGPASWPRDLCSHLQESFCTKPYRTGSSPIPRPEDEQELASSRGKREEGSGREPAVRLLQDVYTSWGSAVAPKANWAVSC